MKEYIVLRPEKHYSHVKIMAESTEDAIALVKDGKGEDIFCEYSDTLDEGWAIEYPPEP